jgi:hypothetical protein
MVPNNKKEGFYENYLVVFFTFFVPLLHENTDTTISNADDAANDSGQPHSVA